MDHPLRYMVLALIVGFLLTVPAPPANSAQILGGNVGIISGDVEKTDSDRGLTVRSSPSSQSAPLAYLPKGTAVKGYRTFSNGYVKLQTPQDGGWVRMDSLSPVGGEGSVASVDKPELCLRIRSGPATSYDKVGCAELGQQLHLTGLWSGNNWAQVDKPVQGWVSANQIESEMAPPGGSSVASGQSRESASRERSSQDDDQFDDEGSSSTVIEETYSYPPVWRHGPPGGFFIRRGRRGGPPRGRRRRR